MDVYNEFEKAIFKRENRGPFALPIDLSNLLGIKKDKLIQMLTSRNKSLFLVSENDYLILNDTYKEINIPEIILTLKTYILNLCVSLV